MLGDGILVTPLLEKNSNKLLVKLPMIKRAKWIADDGKIYKAGTTVLIDVPLNRLLYLF